MNSRSFLLAALAACALGVYGSGCADDESAAQAEPPAPPARPAEPAPMVDLDVPPPGMTDPVLVTVNGRSMTRSMAADAAREIAMRQGVPPQMVDRVVAQAGARLEEQACEQFVDETLLKAEAERQEILVSTQEVNTVIERLSGQLPEGMTIEQALSSRGLTLEQLRSDIENNERLRKLYERTTASAETATDEQVAAYYNSHTNRFLTEAKATARHILVRCEQNEDAAAHSNALAKAESLRTQLLAGTNFADLASSSSDCPSSKQGGSLGSFGRGRMVPAFEQAAFNQPVGEVGPVVKTRFGYHIIEVTDRSDAGMQSLEDVSESIRDQLGSESRNELFGALIEQLREAADISYPQKESGEPATP
jgi:peptidyl-prolyl cis-trans isomerase C